MSGKKVIFVTGATATGKSEWALAVAREVGGVIVNCDSVQVYRGPVIGSNVPSAEDLAAVPHHLYSFVDAPREMTAGEYRREAHDLLKALDAEAIFVVGGTGFYFQALEKGMFELPPVDEALSGAVRAQGESAQGAAALWAELSSGDPETAARLSPNDSYRIARAVELLRIGVRPSERRASFRPEPFPYPLLKADIRVERADLNRRIHQRTRQMLDRGLLAETAELLQRGLEAWAPLQAVGYKEAVRCLKGELGAEKLADEIALRTTQLARRQENWFKREPEREVFTREAGFPPFRERCLRFLEGADRMGAP